MAQRKGTVKDVQGILRHSRTATTTDVYMQELPEGVRATVNSIHKELKTGTGGSGAVATSRSTQSTAKPASAGPESETRVVEMPVTRNELKSGKLTRHFRKERWEELKTFLDEGFEICCQFAAKHQGRGAAKARLDSNQRPFPCQGMRQSVNNRRHSTYQLAESAKTAQLALFAAKMLPNLPERANGLIVWDQLDNLQHFVQSRTSARDRQRPG